MATIFVLSERIYSKILGSTSQPAPPGRLANGFSKGENMPIWGLNVVFISLLLFQTVWYFYKKYKQIHRKNFSFNPLYLLILKLYLVNWTDFMNFFLRHQGNFPQPLSTPSSRYASKIQGQAPTGGSQPCIFSDYASCMSYPAPENFPLRMRLPSCEIHAEKANSSLCEVHFLLYPSI